MAKTYRVTQTNPHIADPVVDDVSRVVIGDGDLLPSGTLQLLDGEGELKAMFAPGQWVAIHVVTSEQDGGN